jgi:hypothetical protein
MQHRKVKLIKTMLDNGVQKLDKNKRELLLQFIDFSLTCYNACIMKTQHRLTFC